MTNILEMPTPLERCAAKIKAALNRQDEGREAWIAASIDLCIELATARDQFPDDDRSFGRWCNDNGFGEDVLRHQVRAACVAMGREPDALRATLAITKRSSLEWIYREESSMFTRARKDTRPKTEKPVKAKPGTDRAYKAIREAHEAGRPIPTADELHESVGVSNISAQKGRLQFETEQRLRREVQPVDPETFAPSMRERFEATIRQYRKTVRFEIEEEIRAEHMKAWDELFLPHWAEKIKEAERIIAARKGVFSRREFNGILLYCVHADTWANATEAQRHQATQLLIKHKDVLVQQPPEELKFPGPPLPKTAAEMMQRAAEVKAKRAAERKAAAARKAPG